jgi:hypothetical protein
MRLPRLSKKWYHIHLHMRFNDILILLPGRRASNMKTNFKKGDTFLLMNCYLPALWKRIADLPKGTIRKRYGMALWTILVTERDSLVHLRGFDQNWGTVSPRWTHVFHVFTDIIMHWQTQVLVPLHAIPVAFTTIGECFAIFITIADIVILVHVTSSLPITRAGHIRAFKQSACRSLKMKSRACAVIVSCNTKSGNSKNTTLCLYRVYMALKLLQVLVFWWL